MRGNRVRVEHDYRCREHGSLPDIRCSIGPEWEQTAPICSTRSALPTKGTYIFGRSTIAAQLEPQRGEKVQTCAASWKMSGSVTSADSSQTTCLGQTHDCMALHSSFFGVAVRFCARRIKITMRSYMHEMNRLCIYRASSRNVKSGFEPGWLEAIFRVKTGVLLRPPLTAWQLQAVGGVKTVPGNPHGGASVCRPPERKNTPAQKSVPFQSALRGRSFAAWQRAG